MSESVHRYSTAKGYFQAAIMLSRSPERNTDGRRIMTILPLSMLCAFALELYFKAWLLACGLSSREVKDYSHKIGELYRDATRERLPAIPKLDELVSALRAGHEDFTFRYIDDGDSVKDVNWERAFAVLNVLDNIVDAKVGASAAHNLLPGH